MKVIGRTSRIENAPLAPSAHRFLTRLLSGILLSLIVVKHSSGCPICFELPPKTLADYLLESDCVAFAREHPEQPFSYRLVEILKGEHDDRPIELVLNSENRRVLASAPSRHAILVRPKSAGPWRSLGVATPALESVVRRIILFEPEWKAGGAKVRRVDFFLRLFGDADRQVRELAYLEMGKAPYGAIKRLGRVATRKQIEPMLRDRQYLKWRSLAILLLAHIGDQSDQEGLIHSFHTAERFQIKTNLSALAAASIEIQGIEALRFIETRYFRDPARSSEELVELVKALSLHGSEGDSERRRQIIGCYETLLDHYPLLAPLVAVDLRAWKRTELRGKLLEIEASSKSLDYAQRQTIRRYIQMALP